MVILAGDNLGERQRDLNNKVAEAIAIKKEINDIISEEEISDVDKLYKIDIASQYQDIYFIVEVLKSSDSLYISRALKCLWIYQDNYDHIFNAENVHVNIFPFMSIKMKKKMLSTISMYIRNNDRAANYFTYCKKSQMPKIALKFLNFTSEEFRLNVLKKENCSTFKATSDSLNLYSYFDKQMNLQNFVGNSFLLATTCIEIFSWKRDTIIDNLRYLYTVSNEQYLDLLEKCENTDLKKPNVLKRLGIRISRDIMHKHKNRVLENPLLYVNKLNKCMLVKYSSKCDAKRYITSLIPPCMEDFWQIDFCNAYDYILNIISINENFEYIKQLFTTIYPGAAFEMSINFYKLKYYNMLSVDQRELWALRHIEEQLEILGNGNDYIWYQFVHIDKALIDIKKYIMITPDSDKRSDIVNILVKAARDQTDLKKVLDYYYERHINEDEHHKNSFVDKVINVHNVFDFNIECWDALNKLFHSLDLYCVGKYSDKKFVAVAVVCHILHNVDMPQALLDFVELDVNYSYFSLILDKLSKEKSETVLQYLLKLFVDKLRPFEQDPHNKKLAKQLKKYVNNIFNLLSCFKKEDKDCPDIVTKFMNIHSPQHKERRTVSAKNIFRYIKTNARQSVDALPDFDFSTRDCSTFNTILRKLKVYFHNDVAQEYINFLDQMIHKCSDNYDSHNVIDVAIFGIFQLASETFKVTLIEKYLPSEAKINHSVIDRKLLYIQEAICKFVCYSRPPIPLKYVIQYIKGDYVHYCLPMFNMYSVNLPLPLVVKFTEGLLNAPLSVQKHGLRLAFHCYDSENLKTLILSTWKNSKNISLRMIIYKLLFDKFTIQTSLKDDTQDARILYDVLKFFTADLHQDDHEDLFELISSDRVFNTFIDDYLQTAWKMVIKLPKKPVNFDRQRKIIRSIEQNLKFVDRQFVRQKIIDEHVHEMLMDRRLRPDELNSLQELWNAKWNLTANYIVQYSDSDELEQSLELVSWIFKKCVDMWHERYEESYLFQKFYFDFIGYIENNSYIIWYQKLKNSDNIPIFKHILDLLQGVFPLKEIYLIVWSLKLTIYVRMAVSDTDTVLSDRGEKMKTLSHEEIKLIGDNISNDIQMYVQELLVKNQFYPAFLPELARLIKYTIRHVKYRLAGIDLKNFDIIFSQSLANVGLKETHLLTLMILPTDVPKQMKELHSIILQKIQLFENEEVQSYLHYKFMTPYKT